ncbi:MAG: GNAT family N-acetyltransferase [Alphaproteobacteria bacterium]|nr:GNAT family N-acetyltransferase [Alphaproteobacteria bacterium]
MICIREANKGDVETLCGVLCASIRELCTADHKDDPETIARWTANKTPEHVAGWIADPRRTLFLAAREDQPAGVGCISDGGEVLLNYVAPAHRFCGVSRALLAHIEAVLVENGVTTARLTSTETAHRFYREAGWADVGEPEILFGLRGYPMEKDLRVRPGSDGR